MKIPIALALAFGLILASAGVSANTECKGPINNVYLNPIGGFVQVDFGFGANTICSLNTEMARITPTNCKAIYGAMLAAQIAGKIVHIRYNGDFACSQSELGNFEDAKKEAYLIWYK